MRNHSYENAFCQQIHFHAYQTHFRVKGFARGLVFKQRRKVYLPPQRVCEADVSSVRPSSEQSGGLWAEYEFI